MLAALRVAAGGCAPPIASAARRGREVARSGRESRLASRTGKQGLPSCGDVNRPGFAGGQFAWVTPPWRGPQAEHSSAPRPRQAGCCRSAREEGGWYGSGPTPRGGNERVPFLALGRGG